MWRAAVCPEEFEATDDTRRRVKWAKAWGNNPAYSVEQVRTNHSDQANTILKMAKKRAMVDLCLTATAASDVFAQDLEDMPPELIQEHERRQKEHNSKPRTASGNSGKPASPSQCKLMRNRLFTAQKTEQWLCEQFKISTLEEMSMGQVNEALDKIAAPQ